VNLGSSLGQFDAQAMRGCRHESTYDTRFGMLEPA
jgi:hypothetical protein